MIDSPTSPRPRLPALKYYGLTVAGWIFGVALCCLCGWLYLHAGDNRKPTGIRIWQDSAEAFIIPICAMIGGTFGGVLGVGLAMLLDYRFRSAKSQ